MNFGHKNPIKLKYIDVEEFIKLNFESSIRLITRISNFWWS